MSRSTLEWYSEAGVTDVTQNTPRNYLAEKKTQPVPEAVKPLAKQQENNFVPKPVSQAQILSSPSLVATISEARQLAENVKNLDELRAAVESFNGCSLKKTANKTVFADGNPNTGVMLIGEAPGADEDIQGIPFCGQSGKLLDKVLHSIKLDRKTGFYITNTLFWRPPGNRKPTPEELAICEPFLEKHVALVNPKIILLVGATAVQGILKDSSAMAKLRGKVFTYKNRYMQNDVPVMVTYHPSFLLRAPINKRLAWEDMLRLDEELKKLGIKK